ncbi:hypothetical protein BpHYR1_053112 [Brachionus plicatilis]|uniref:Uncharacterized protein n=1 Tax=Brachionus plicatilis TaxID=10195 RepID=A0A3M7RC17_BRAPC|nr:hypothetical protein BpHYR1_053112 [Brachionus plicatilis]
MVTCLSFYNSHGDCKDYINDYHHSNNFSRFVDFFLPIFAILIFFVCCTAFCRLACKRNQSSLHSNQNSRPIIPINQRTANTMNTQHMQQIHLRPIADHLLSDPIKGTKKKTVGYEN